jgi:hypothetical protein
MNTIEELPTNYVPTEDESGSSDDEEDSGKGKKKKDKGEDTWEWWKVCCRMS